MYNCSLTPKADVVYVTKHSWNKIQCTLSTHRFLIDELQDQINTITGLGIPDEVVTETEFDMMWHDHLVDAFGVKVP